MPEDETIEHAREDEREGKSPSTQAGEFVREEMEHIREGEARRPIAGAGDRHWSVQGAASRSKVAASKTRPATNKAPGKARSCKGPRRAAQEAFSKAVPRNKTRS